ncbi:MAG: flagellar motor stator protein MotA [Maritimibacter sp.]|jgi:chemotaxis protein MotA
MVGLIGIIMVFALVFGGFIAEGGNLTLILEVAPYEFTMIMGAAFGAFVISNDVPTIKHTLKDVSRVFKGTRWKPSDYKDLLCLLFELIRQARQNAVALEEHIELPEESAIFTKYPKILADKEAINLICDTLRSASMNYDDPHQVEEVLEKRMEANLEAAKHSGHNLQTMADGLPALGIVVAVLGVIKTMGSIDQPPEILGHMIGGALAGTFMGVFIAYGLVGPFASKLTAVAEEDAHFYQLIREVLVANLHNHSTNICIEVGRQNTPSSKRPSFSDLEEALKDVKKDVA